MDHQLISTVLKKFKKNDVPKYLQKWIRFGQIIEDDIKPLQEPKLNSTVAQYCNEYAITTYGKIIVWFGDFEAATIDRRMLKVRLNDSVENI